MGPNKAKARDKKTPTKPRETLVAKRRREDKERDENTARVRREQEVLMGVDAKRIKERAPRQSNAGGSRRSSQTSGDNDRKAAGLKRNQNRAAASRNRTASGKNPVSASPGTGANNSSTKSAKAPRTGGKSGKAPEKKGFFGRLGGKLKKATTLTPGRPRKPLGSAAKSPEKMRKYKSDMKAWRASQESSKGKASGGRVTAKKPTAKKPTAKKLMAKKPTAKKRMPRRP